MNDLEALATRLEQAGPESQAELLREAWNKLNGPRRRTGEEWYALGKATDRFDKMLDCGAYLSAAEMLVPDGFSWAVGGSVECGASSIASTRAMFKGKASTPALALSAACLRAAIAGKEI